VARTAVGLVVIPSPAAFWTAVRDLLFIPTPEQQIPRRATDRRSLFFHGASGLGRAMGKSAALLGMTPF